MANQAWDGEMECFICGDFNEIKTSRKGKPYIVCERDGIQIFFRRKPGIDRLVAMVNGGDDAES